MYPDVFILAELALFSKLCRVLLKRLYDKSWLMTVPGTPALFVNNA